MKKFIVLSLAVGILVSFGSASFAQSPSLYLELEKTVSTGFDTSNYALDVGASSSFYISVYAKNVLKLLSFQIDITYNSTNIPGTPTYNEFAIGTPFEQSPIIGATKFLTVTDTTTVSKKFSMAQSKGPDYTGVDIGNTWTFLGRLDFTTGANFSTADSTLFTVTNAMFGTFAGAGVDPNYISAPPGNITHAGLNTTEIPTGTPETAPIIAVQPTSLDFDYVHVDSTKSLPVLVINNGDTLLNVDSVQVPTGFSIDPQDSSGIAAGDTVTFTVTFTPTAQDEYTDLLVFFSNDTTTGPVVVNVHGTAIITEPAPIIALSPMSLDFDSVYVDSSKSLPVLVINTGDAPLNVDSVQVPAGFSIDPQDSSGIAAGDTVTFTVTFTPTAQVEYTDSLMFFSNDIITGPVAVNVHGTAIVTRVISGPETVPGSYRLGPNYPNPFNPTTNIPFELKANGRVTITVYNLLGQKVAEVVNGYYTEGKHTVLFDARGLGSGIYFYRMEANGFTDVKKFVYIR